MLQIQESKRQLTSLARVIVDELLGDFGNRNDLSNWFDREDTATTALVKKPNPRNTQNAAKLQELEIEIARYVESGTSLIYHNCS